MLESNLNGYCKDNFKSELCKYKQCKRCAKKAIKKKIMNYAWYNFKIKTKHSSYEEYTFSMSLKLAHKIVNKIYSYEN